MKKLVCLWMTLALLLGACPAFAADADATDALLEQLDAYLTCCEQLYTAYADTLQSMLDFRDRQNYASLLHARLASDGAHRTLTQLTAPAFSLSGDALSALMALGVETDALEVEMQDLAVSIEMARDEMGSYEARLERVLLHSDGLDSFARWAQLDQQFTALEIQYTWAMVNYLLLPVASQAQVEAFWAGLAQRYPTMGSYLPAWESDGNALITRAVECLDDMEPLTEQIAVQTGQLAYGSEQFALRVQQDDQDALRATAAQVEGMPAMAPLPVDWLAPETSSILAEGEGDLPATLTLEDPAVSLASFSGYVNLLCDAGATLVRHEGTDETGWTYELRLGDSALTLQWQPDGVARVQYDPAALSLEPALYMLCR